MKSMNDYKQHQEEQGKAVSELAERPVTRVRP
jgi:hypothetical protein